MNGSECQEGRGDLQALRRLPAEKLEAADLCEEGQLSTMQAYFCHLKSRCMGVVLERVSPLLHGVQVGCETFVLACPAAGQQRLHPQTLQVMQCCQKYSVHVFQACMRQQLCRPDLTAQKNSGNASFIFQHMRSENLCQGMTLPIQP